MSARTRNGRTTRKAPTSPLFIPVAAVLTIWVLFGGGEPDGLVPFQLLALSGSVLLALVVLRGGVDAFRSLSWPARLMLLFFWLMPLLQLVPLPPAVWQGLPGRALAVQTLGAAGAADGWHPITLAVLPTFRTFLEFTWLIALLLAVLQLSTDEVRRIFGLLLVLGLVNVALGVIQVASGHRIELYPSSYLTGLFANKNHTGLFIALTLLAGYAALYAQGWHRRRLALVIPVALVLFIALLATFSRAGVLFGLAALAFLAWMSLDARALARHRLLLIAVPIAVAVLVAVISSSDIASRGMARFEDVGEDLRWSIWQWSWPLVTTYFPIGSGIGSFTSVFPPHEQLAWVKPTYVNHAHNDYLEQLIEVGVAAPIFWVLTVIALCRPVRLAWAERTDRSGRLALIGLAVLVVIAVHSAFDYPLRRPAIAATAALALAAVLRLSADKSRLRDAAGYVRHAS